MNILRSALLKSAHWTRQRHYCTTQFSELSAIVQRLCDETRPVNVNDAERFVQQYRGESVERKNRLLTMIARQHSVNSQQLTALSRIVVEKLPHVDATTIYGHIDRGNRLLTPTYRQLFYALSQLPDGVQFLCTLRADLLELVNSVEASPAEYGAVRLMSQQLKMILSIMFATGQLQLQRVTWQTSADILEKAVHPIHSWMDLRRRLGHRRRVFIFTHPTMPREPLVMLHVALCPRIEHSIQNLIMDRRQQLQEQHRQKDTEGELSSDINTAIFYSISSINPGLRGIDLGNQLIKKVVGELKRELPQLYKYCTLSPMPGFGSWLKRILDTNDSHNHLSSAVRAFINTHVLKKDANTSVEEMCSALKALLVSRENACADAKVWRALEPVLRHLGAQYLCTEKHRGYALDSVANFHIRNGACVWRVNFDGDVSPRGWSQSFSLMAHYRYNTERLQENIETYARDKRVDISYKMQAVLDFSSLLRDYEYI